MGFHPIDLEDEASRNLFGGWEQESERSVSSSSDSDDEYDDDRASSASDDDWRYSRQPRPRSNEIDTQFALLIEASAQGSRIFIYEFPTRKLRVHGLKNVRDALENRLPKTPVLHSRWTRYVEPRLASLDSHHQVRALIRPLLDFAESALRDYRRDWSKYPLYVHVTDWTLNPDPEDINLLKKVRQILWSDDFNSFDFESRNVKIISPEERATLIWTAVNFARQIPLLDGQDVGNLGNTSSSDFGVLELSEASFQSSMIYPQAAHYACMLGESKDWTGYCLAGAELGTTSAWYSVVDPKSSTNSRTKVVILRSNSTSRTGPYSPSQMICTVVHRDSRWVSNTTPSSTCSGFYLTRIQLRSTV